MDEQLFSAYISDSQTGTLGCRKEVSGVPPNLESRTFLMMLYYIECHKLSFLTQEGAAKFFLGPEGCRESKKIEKHWLTYLVGTLW
jgi:hypothetical protein